ncbi:hypothetical protein KVT40_001775 [Elsinoe batatas]|uniref:White collar-2 n=1 Tax=Elsinoe batatas TaxID=2601811 RepID=A0A8K0L9B3_9PEZI|nr:hypothetical protein KVT40_001775 [Elsinoe batatas]
MDPLSDISPAQNMVGGMTMPDMLHDGADLMAGLDGDMMPMDLDFDTSLTDANFDQLTGMPSMPQQNSNETNNSTELMGQDDGNLASGVGAGPLPTGFGMGPPASSSTLTDFTKRRNWSQRVIEELKDFLHILTPDGRILYVSPSCKSITGYEPGDLIGKFMGDFVHPDDSGIFMREFNESIASANALRFFYRFKKDDGTYVIFECDGHPHISSETPTIGFNGMGMNQSPSMAPTTGFCRGFFMMARPYPTRNAALLDSFLEHKIENERLMKRIEELKKEEVEENEAQERQWQAQSASQRNESTPMSDGHGLTSTNPDSGRTPNYQGMPPPAKPPISNTALTRQNLDSALSSQRPDSIADKMSRYEGSNHLETIEMLTGLRYRDGERSHGISTGDTSPALIRGDAGIAILLDRDRDGGKEKKKKLKVADEYVCADCGTLDSPEWRKGPKGPKTLCNACGLRWAKKEKKRTGVDNGSGQTAGQTPGGNSSMMSTPGMVKQDSGGSL